MVKLDPRSRKEIVARAVVTAYPELALSSLMRMSKQALFDRFFHPSAYDFVPVVGRGRELLYTRYVPMQVLK